MEENHIFVREEALQEQEGNASHLCVNDHAALCLRPIPHLSSFQCTIWNLVETLIHDALGTPSSGGQGEVRSD